MRYSRSIQISRVEGKEQRVLTDTELLSWWESHLNYQHGIDYESGEVVMYKIVGNVNDREWHEVARAATLREALQLTIAKISADKQVKAELSKGDGI